MGARKRPARAQDNTGNAAVQVGIAGGHVTVIQQTHHHYAQPAGPSRTLLALRVYEPHQLPRRVATVHEMRE